ncbi:MAG: hypothetical protein WBH86_15345, partial [Thermogutta sp.]
FIHRIDSVLGIKLDQEAYYYASGKWSPIAGSNCTYNLPAGTIFGKVLLRHRAISLWVADVVENIRFFALGNSPFPFCLGILKKKSIRGNLSLRNY